MEHESFENEQIAALMNELFVNIKVDREERPDLDEIYMNAVQMLTGRGGWPMTMFLTPDRQPFYGGTYFPPQDRHGMPGFPRVLSRCCAGLSRQRPTMSRKALTQILTGFAANVATPSEPMNDFATVDHCAKPPNRLRALTMPRMAVWGKHRNFPTLAFTSYFCASIIIQESNAFSTWSTHTLTKMAARRNLRSSGRRISSLFSRREVARAAFRENALRQRTARAHLRACCTEHR